MAEELEQRRAEVWAKHRIDGEQALDLIALSAKADISGAYDDEGKLRPVHEWPLELRMCVQEVKADGSAKLLNPLKARELVAVAGGKIRQTLDVVHFDHKAYLASKTGPDGKPAGPAANEA